MNHIKKWPQEKLLPVGGSGPLICANDPNLPGGCYLSSTTTHIGYNRYELPSANDDCGNIYRETCVPVDQEIYTIFKADNEQGLYFQIEVTCNRAQTAI